MSATALVGVRLGDVKDNEYIALECLDNGWYDTSQHPRMGVRLTPIYHLVDGKWTLLSANKDTLFETVGAGKRDREIEQYLASVANGAEYLELNIAEYNQRAAEELRLVHGVDYEGDHACQLPKMDVGGRNYFIVHAYTYSLFVDDKERVVNVVCFDGMRLPDIEVAEQHAYDEMFKDARRRLSVDCEAGVFAASIQARDFLVLQYDVESAVYVPKQAASTRLYLMYAADKAFFAAMTPTVLKFHMDFHTSNVSYTQIDNLTIGISATLLELLCPQERSVQRAALHAHNVELLRAMGTLRTHQPDETVKFEYLDIPQCDYAMFCQAFEQLMGREPQADILLFNDD